MMSGEYLSAMTCCTVQHALRSTGSKDSIRVVRLPQKNYPSLKIRLERKILIRLTFPESVKPSQFDIFGTTETVEIADLCRISRHQRCLGIRKKGGIFELQKDFFLPRFGGRESGQTFFRTRINLFFVLFSSLSSLALFCSFSPLIFP